MVSSKGLDLSDPIIKTTLIHAGLNDLAIVGAVYSWLAKRLNEDFVPTGGTVMISSLMLGAVAYAAYLGGGLVYTHGTGVQRMGQGKREKEQARAEDEELEEQVEKVHTSLDKALK